MHTHTHTHTHYQREGESQQTFTYLPLSQTKKTNTNQAIKALKMPEKLPDVLKIEHEGEEEQRHLVAHF